MQPNWTANWFISLLFLFVLLFCFGFGCFCFRCFVFLLLCFCCFVFLVLFLSLLFLLFVCPRTTQPINKKTTKTLASYCCLPFVPGKVLPRERERDQQHKTKNTKGLFHSSFVFHPCHVSFFLFHFIFLFYLSSFVSVFLLFLSSFLNFLPFIFIPFPSNFTKATRGKETMKKKKTTSVTRGGQTRENNKGQDKHGKQKQEPPPPPAPPKKLDDRSESAVLLSHVAVWGSIGSLFASFPGLRDFTMWLTFGFSVWSRKNLPTKWQVHHKIQFLEGGVVWLASLLGDFISILYVVFLFCLGFFGCSTVLILLCFNCCWLLLLFWFVHCSLLLLVVVLLLFCYSVGVLLLLFFLCFVVVLFLLFCLSCFVFVVIVLVVCLPKNNPTNEQKTTKTLASYCCLPFVPGKVLPRERERGQQHKKKKTKGLFHSSFVFHPCHVSFIFLFYLSSFVSVFILFLSSFLKFFHLFLFLFLQTSQKQQEEKNNEETKDNISNKRRTNKRR